jgi:predicted transcriptional regulator
MRPANYTTQELCNEIYKAVLEAATPLTRLEICWAIGRKKSPHIVNMINSLTANGWFDAFESTDKHGRPAFRYRVTSKAHVEDACAGQ